MPEKPLQQQLTERSPSQCDCAPLKIANFAIAEAAGKIGARLERVLDFHNSIIDPDCPGMVEIPDACARDGCMPDRECGHKNGPGYLLEATQSVEL